MSVGNTRIGPLPAPKAQQPVARPAVVANGARAPRFAGVPTVDRIAAASDVSEAYRRGSVALIELLAPACCLIFDRDEFGQLGLAYRLNLPEREEPELGPADVMDQVQGWWLATLQTSGPLTSPRPQALPGQASTVVIPLVASESLHGFVVLQECERGLDPEVERETIAIATTVSLTLHSLVLRASLTRAITPEQLEEAITQERRRIAREIHDGVAQSLAYLNLKTELLDRLVARDPAAAREQAAVVRQLLQSAMTDLRRCIGDLRRPATGQGPAMTSQLRSLASSLGEMPNLELALQQVSGTRLAPEVERTVIGIVREALQNIRKHADANSVRVEVAREDDALHLQVIDDGRGFHPDDLAAQAGQHFGLTQMRELAQEMGGHLFIDSQQGAGTRIEALIPLRAATPAAQQSTGNSSG
ncbi:MAG: sensor histidine kinase [Thermomicrobiales bacterium]